LKLITEKNREENLEKMMRILINGANEQLYYQQKLSGIYTESDSEDIEENEYNDFFDI
jgi:hypothetical protein